VALSTEAKDDDGNRKDSYTLPAAASESSSMPSIMDLWSSANVSAIRLVQKDSSSNDYQIPDSPIIRSAVPEAPSLVHGPSFTVRPIPMPALPEPLPVPPPAFRPTPMPDTLAIGLLARLPEWVTDVLFPTPDLYTHLAALLELIDWSLRAQGLEGLGVGWREYFATLR
jgi:hypothetical protein